MLLSISEMYLKPKAKTSLRVLKIQHPRVAFEPHMKRIRIPIPIPECHQNVSKKTGFEFPCFGFESQF